MILGIFVLLTAIVALICLFHLANEIRGDRVWWKILLLGLGVVLFSLPFLTVLILVYSYSAGR